MLYLRMKETRDDPKDATNMDSERVNRKITPTIQTVYSASNDAGGGKGYQEYTEHRFCIKGDKIFLFIRLV